MVTINKLIKFGMHHHFDQEFLAVQLKGTNKYQSCEDINLRYCNKTEVKLREGPFHMGESFQDSS